MLLYKYERQKRNYKYINCSCCYISCYYFSFYSLKHKTEKGQTDENNLSEIINNNKVEEKLPENKENNMEKISKAGDRLSMNYTGRFIDGTAFDSNVDPKFGHVEPFVFTLGTGQVIAGWDEGLVGMKIGEKKTLTIPPEKAYGSRQVGPIPANSTLIFDVELVDIQ